MKQDYLIDFDDYTGSLFHEWLLEEEQKGLYFAILPQVPDYVIVSDGRIWSSRHGKVLKAQICAGNQFYSRARLRWEGTLRNLRVHRLVALSFIENPNNELEVDHINCNRSDNRIENLRWVNRKTNMNNLKCHQKKPHNPEYLRKNELDISHITQ